MSDNLQYANTGNTGDILKHAALVQLASWFRTHATSNRAWLDTHCFLLEAELANANWQQEIEQWVSHYPVYDIYRKLEQAYVAKGRYRCSTGLVIDLLPEISLLLSEHNPQTRRILQQQLDNITVSEVMLIENMHDWQSRTDLPPYDALLALLDPFRLDKAEWDSACRAIEKILKPGGLGILEVFTYERDGKFQSWPAAPDGWTGPVAMIDHAPYYLAVYTTRSHGDEIGDLLTVPGWLSAHDNGS